MPVRAEGLAKGSNLLSFQLTTGTADLATPEGGTGGITAYDHSEWGGQIHFQRLLSDDWAHGVEAAVDIALLGRYYERIADHAVSVGNRVVFVVTGQFPVTSDK